jgi:hypothetical protein
VNTRAVAAAPNTTKANSPPCDSSSANCRCWPRALERFEVGLQRVAVFRIGQQHAGHEGAQRHRHPDPLHQQADRDHQQQGEGGEDLARVGAGDDLQQRAHQVAAAEDQAAQHADHLQRREPEVAARAGVVGDAEQGHDGDHRDRGDVLEQQDREAGLAGGRRHQVAFFQRGEGDRGGRQRQAEAGDQRHLPADTGQQRSAEQASGDAGDLGAAPAEDGPAQRPQAVRFELEADQEQQQHHAELGEVQGVFDIGDELQAVGADQDAGRQVAEHGAHAEAFRERHRDHGGGEVDEGVGQQAVFHRLTLRWRIRAARTPAAAA